MRTLYLVAGIARILSGVLAMFLPNDFFGGYGGDVGLIAVSAGLIHVLNWEYGPVTRGFRYAALFAGISSSVLGIWQWLPWLHWQEAAIVLLCPVATLLSFSVWPQVRRRVRVEVPR